VLVVDIMEGFKPQTIESLQVLRRAQTPFILVLNKIDRLPGWRTRKGTFAANRQEQSQLAQRSRRGLFLVRGVSVRRLVVAGHQDRPHGGR
jgi:translation initiation factor 5B